MAQHSIPQLKINEENKKQTTRPLTLESASKKEKNNKVASLFSCT
jgi:hypothetical protein